VDRADPTGARHPTFVPADVVADDLAAALAAVGHDPRASTLFVCEGLLVYLEPADVVGLLAVLASAAGPGSELVATLAVHPDGLPSDAVVEAANAARPDGTVEPWRTVLPRGEHLGLLTSAGWTVDDVVDDADVLPGAVAGRSLTVTASPTAA
jgi:O-methyltransferase involved in polyketide biosynthesis